MAAHEQEIINQLILTINAENEMAALAQLETYAEKIKTLTHVRISGIPSANKPRWLEAIAKLLSKNLNIITLDLSHNQLNDEEFLFLSKEGLTYCSKIKTLLLNSNVFTKSMFNNLCQLLSTDINLTSLVLGGNRLEDIGGYFKMIQSIPKTKVLESLSLSGNPLTVADLQALLAWQQQAKINHAPQLRSLFLSGVGMTTQHLPCLLELFALPHLIAINLTGNQLNDEDLDTMAQALKNNGTLSQLTITDNHFTEVGLKKLLGVINAENAPNTPSRRKLQRSLKLFARDYHFNLAQQQINQMELTMAIYHYEQAIAYDESFTLAKIGLYQAKIDTLLRQNPIPEIELKEAYQSLQTGWDNLLLTEEYHMKDLVDALRKNTHQMQKLIQARFNASYHMSYFPLWLAIKNKDKTQLEQLVIMQGYDINLPDCIGMTPLHFAAKQNDFDLIKYSLTLGAKANVKAGLEEKYPWQLAKDNSPEQKYLREMLHLHQTEQSHKHSVIRFLFPKLLLVEPLQDSDKKRVIDKLASITTELTLLEQTLQRAKTVYPEKADILQQYYAEYCTIYTPITEVAALPDVYSTDVYELKKVENTLVAECNLLANSNKSADTQLLGYYNQVLKFIADLLQLRELTPAVLHAVHQYYVAHINNPAPALSM